MGLAARARRHARDMYEPERVSTLTRSPMLTNSGHLDRRAGLERRGLVAAARGGVAAHARLGVGDLELDRRRQLQVGGLVVDEQQVDGLVRLGPLQRVLERRLGDRELLEGLLVHEVRVGAVGVEELHLARLGPDRPELLAGAERPVDHGAVGGAPQLRAHERAALAGLDVLELEDLEDRALDLDVVAVLELVRADGHMEVATMPAMSRTKRSTQHRPKRAIGYIRVSERGGRAGPEYHTLDIQRRSIERVCEFRGYELIDTYTEENKSGKDATRPLFEEAMTRIVDDHEADALAVWKVSRFSRSWTQAARDMERLLERKPNPADLPLGRGRVSTPQPSAARCSCASCSSSRRGSTTCSRSMGGHQDALHRARFAPGRQPLRLPARIR